MITADIHAELIAAFFGDDEPCYGQCQCAACGEARTSTHRSSALRLHRTDRATAL